MWRKQSGVVRYCTVEDIMFQLIALNMHQPAFFIRSSGEESEKCVEIFR